MAEERLQKVLAAAGVDSRRACEKLITQGRVQVNGQTVTELGTKVDPEKVLLSVDGKPVHKRKRHLYLKLNKPRDVLSDIGGDTRGRESVADLLPPELSRVFPVGRLDLNSEGLILLTDDGALAHKLTHPSFRHEKVYYVLVESRPPEGLLNQLRSGIDLPEGKTAPAGVSVVDRPPPQMRLAPGPREGCWLKITLREGRKRQIRHMLAAVELKTLRLVRWSIGTLQLGALEVGQHVHLTRGEVTALRNLVQDGPNAPEKSYTPKKSGGGRSSRT